MMTVEISASRDICGASLRKNLEIGGILSSFLPHLYSESALNIKRILLPNA